MCTDKGILAVEQNKVLVPPTWSKTFAWGYADLSCRLANYESDKVGNHPESLFNLRSLGFAVSTFRSGTVSPCWHLTGSTAAVQTRASYFVFHQSCPVLVPGAGGVRVSVRVGSDPLCHLSQPQAGHHRRHQHCHLCVGDGDLQGEGQVTDA